MTAPIGEAIARLEQAYHSASIDQLDIRVSKADLRLLLDDFDRLTKTVASGILGELLAPDESEEMVKFIKFLRDGKKS